MDVANKLVIEGCAVFSVFLANEIVHRINSKKKKPRKKRRWWVKEWIARREVLGPLNSIANELRENYPQDFRSMLRMTPENFDRLLEKVYPYIVKEDTQLRLAVPPKLKLEVTLRYLAIGDSFGSLELLFRLPKSTICKFLNPTLKAIIVALKDHLKVPENKEEWLKVEQGFHERWDFPGCIGAVDGKHVQIRRPAKSGSVFYNYKHFYSIILLALVDADYRFIYVEVGANGRCNDGGVWEKSSLHRAFKNNLLNSPSKAVIVGDDAFPLQTYLMKPYQKRYLPDEQRICNYRFSRARRVSENAFGILCSRFQVFSKPIALKSLDTIDNVVLAVCTLHNWLRNKSANYLTPSCVDRENENYELVPGTWRESVIGAIHNLQPTASKRSSTKAEKVRDCYKEYFNNDGSVWWQRRAVGLEYVSRGTCTL